MTPESAALDAFLSACIDGGMNGNNMKKAMAEYVKPSGPAWHDAPNKPGLWLNSVFMKVEDVEQWHIDCQLHLECARWFGPISPDTEDAK